MMSRRMTPCQVVSDARPYLALVTGSSAIFFLESNLILGVL